MKTVNHMVFSTYSGKNICIYIYASHTGLIWGNELLVIGDSLKTQHEHPRLQCFKRKTPLPNHEFDSISSVWWWSVQGVHLKLFNNSGPMALKSFPFTMSWLFPWGETSPRGSRTPGAFCYHGTTAQRLKRWIVGRWVELSQGGYVVWVGKERHRGLKVEVDEVSYGKWFKWEGERNWW